MRKQDRLQKEALESCKFRGHEMTIFTRYGNSAAVSHCVHCLKNVYVDTNPSPNGIEISGEAVALTCEPMRQRREGGDYRGGWED